MEQDRAEEAVAETPAEPKQLLEWHAPQLVELTLHETEKTFATAQEGSTHGPLGSTVHYGPS
jgi:hypothetical protein